MKYKINFWYEGTTKLLSKVIEAEDEKSAKAIFHDVYGVRNYEILNINPQPSNESQSLIKSPESAENLVNRSEKDKQQEALIYLAKSKQLSGSKAALAAASESAAKLTAYKSRQKDKQQQALIYLAESKQLSGSKAALAVASESAAKLTAYKSRQKPKEHEHIWSYSVDAENISGPVVFASIQDKIDKGILKEDSLVMKTGGDWMTVSEFKRIGTSSADKLIAYKARQTQKEQEHIWFYTVDGEHISGPIVFASIQNKIDKGVLKEGSLVMKTGGFWMTVSEFKTTGSSIDDAKPSPSFTQPHSARSLHVKATASSSHSTQTAYKSSPYSSSARAKVPNKYPTSVVDEHGFFQKLSSGEFGLAKTYWLYGVVVGFVLSLGIQTITSIGIYTLATLIYAPYQTLVLLGTWRASQKYEGWKGWAALANFSVVLGAIGLIASVIITVGWYTKS